MLLINDRPIETVIYPNNESLLKPKNPGTVTLRYEGDADLFRLQVLAKHLNSRTISRELHIPYMPYSRADRSENGSVFTLRHVAQLIADCKFAKIVVYEPHSDATEQELRRAIGCHYQSSRVVVKPVTVPLATKVMEVMDFQPHDWIVFPDAGAGKRYFGLATEYPVLFGTKHRDFDTGQITELTFPAITPAPGARALIVDDLCSRGGTFIQAAQRLRALGFAEVHLAVAHMEPAGYNTNMVLMLDHIYHTDSITPPTTNYHYTVFSLKGICHNAS